MPDIYSRIAQIETAVQERLADVIEMRAADARQRAMLHDYLSEMDFAPGSTVLEIGSGTGAVARELARWPNVAQAVGVDPSPVFVGRARTLSETVPNVSFYIGDGRNLSFDDDSFDAVVVHTTLCHVPEPERLLAEALRVLRRRGSLALFDGDYATATVATGPRDPLEACVDAFRENFVHDPWLVRRLPKLLRTAGFDAAPTRSHGYVESPEGAYMLTWVNRGADVLFAAGCITRETAEALKAEAQRRSESRTWFGHIAFASVVARKPA
jgi:ubiquinone/menaquinone biosynthesis C-methylase UbiE